MKKNKFLSLKVNWKKKQVSRVVIQNPSTRKCFQAHTPGYSAEKKTIFKAHFFGWNHITLFVENSKCPESYVEMETWFVRILISKTIFKAHFFCWNDID